MNTASKLFFDAINRVMEASGHIMRGGTIVDATIIDAPSSTKNAEKKRDPEMHSTKKGNQWRFGMKCHAGVDAGTGYVHTIEVTPANIHDGAFSMTVEDIEQVVEQCISGTKHKPVVVVDYLQIVAPSMSGRRKMDTKEAIDHIVHKLKALQSKYDLTVIVISSLNRQNYLTPIDFESFKESGGIEYTADVIWGLQLAVMSDELFGKEGKIKEKREKIRAAKAANPRAIDLVCVKNRYGRANYTTQFSYYPVSDMFIPYIGP